MAQAATPHPSPGHAPAFASTTAPTISEDDLKRAEKELQRLTDQYVAEIDRVLDHKEKELLEV